MTLFALVLALCTVTLASMKALGLTRLRWRYVVVPAVGAVAILGVTLGAFVALVATLAGALARAF